MAVVSFWVIVFLKLLSHALFQENVRNSCLAFGLVSVRNFDASITGTEEDRAN